MVDDLSLEQASEQGQRQQRQNPETRHEIEWYLIRWLRFRNKIWLTLEMIKFEHSVFALPFALTGALLAWREEGFPDRAPGLAPVLDRDRDGGRALGRDGLQPGAGRRHRRAQSAHRRRGICPPAMLTRGFAWGFIVISSAAFMLAASSLNPLCFLLSPVALAMVFFYSFTKRFTSLSHLVLGFALGIAPAAAWIAMRGSLDPRILWLTAAVTFWTAGFDIIYSCQDYEFDVADRAVQPAAAPRHRRRAHDRARLSHRS